jgi:DNA-3-methyladenine glycosylase
MPKRIENFANKLNRSFFLRNDVVLIAKELLGKVLVTKIDGNISKGVIVETEAYCGRNDKACHANNGLRTKRTEIMYAEGGRAYVYLCYGIHHLFNVVTNIKDKADAILVRALEPLEGEGYLKERTKSTKLTNGPGLLSKAMGITMNHNGKDLLGGEIWIESGIKVNANPIVHTTRVGVDYAEEDAKLPWRFYISNNEYISKT